MKNLKKYGCYTLLAVAVMLVLWAVFGFIANEYNTTEWKESTRFLIIWFGATIVGCTIGYHETK
jgi:TRAP-type C4-dicarboxylate transport system permease small subunit